MINVFLESGRISSCVDENLPYVMQNAHNNQSMNIKMLKKNQQIVLQFDIIWVFVALALC